MQLLLNLIIYLIKVFIVYIAFFSMTSAIMKISSFEYFIATTNKISNYKINNTVIRYSAIIFLIIELLSPLLMLIEEEINILFATLLLLIYILATLYILPVVVKDIRVECGCFGSYFNITADWYKVLENTIYIVLILCIYVIKDVQITSFTYIFALILLIIRLYFLQKRGKYI